MLNQSLFGQFIADAMHCYLFIIFLQPFVFFVGFYHPHCYLTIKTNYQFSFISCFSKNTRKFADIQRSEPFYVEVTLPFEMNEIVNINLIYYQSSLAHYI